MQVWAYSPAALYQLYTRPGRVTDIVLQAGEELVDISTPDPIRWIVGNTVSGEGRGRRVHISIKPTRPDLQTNLVIYTNRRTYYLEARATAATWIASASWHYPLESQGASTEVRVGNVPRGTPIAEGVQLENINFHYQISGAKAAWRPVRAFDDGNKVYIQFPDNIDQIDMPPMFLRGRSGDAELVNYRVRAPYYIVDRLFESAELRLGGKKAQVVRVTRIGKPPRDDGQGEVR